jgi:hypothetical protein
MRIRHYDFLAYRTRRASLAKIRLALQVATTMPAQVETSAAILPFAGIPCSGGTVR